MYHPLAPGAKAVFAGTGALTGFSVGFQAMGVEVIDGIRCLKVFDDKWDGDIYEWFAQDTSGAVWRVLQYDVGEDEYDEEHYLQMPASPKLGEVYELWLLEYEVVSLTATVKTAAGTFTGCLHLKCVDPAWHDGSLNEYYAPGVGLVKAIDSWGGYELKSISGLKPIPPGKQTCMLVVQINGSGFVSPDLNGRYLTVGQSYSLTAIPLAGHLFTGWTDGNGASLTLGTKLTFTMKPDLVLVANFVPNPFVAAKGVYNGLFYEVDNVRAESSGSFCCTVTEALRYSIKASTGGKTSSYSGVFDSTGKTSFILVRKGLNNLQVNLELEQNDSGRLVGHVADGNWIAALEGHRSVYDGRTRLAPQAGRYTLVLPGGDNSASGPGGDSHATVTVDKAGKISLAGMLADEIKISQATTISENGDWPLYVPLYGGQGCLVSWMKFGDTDASDLDGKVIWLKAASPTAKMYPGGFALDVDALGSPYAPPAKGGKILPLVEANIVFIGGGLSQNITNPFILGLGNAVTDQGANKLKLKFTSATGAFSGTVNHPDMGKPISFSGVVLQNAGSGRGFFINGGVTGHLLIFEK